MEITPFYFNYTLKGIACQVLGEYLNKLDWSFFFTGTFKKDFRRDSAVKSFYKWFNTMTWIKGQRNFGYAWFMEWHKWRDVPHIHSLLYLPEVKNATRLVDWWQVWFKKYGRCKIVKYDKEIGAGYYLSKYVAKDYLGRGDWFIDYPK